MCGISGIVSSQIDQQMIEQVRCMTRLQHHRGPDSQGLWHDQRAVLGHNRLSIIDLADGNQPMTTEDGRYTVVFNGEIYNFKELRATLPKGTLRSHSDTEVLLELFAREGVNALRKFNGMFSFAVWDRQQQELVIARDRLGVKPLYYSRVGDKLCFSSELGALRAITGPQTIDRAAVIGYLRASYVPGDRSIYSNVHKLQPGSFLRFRGGELSTERYWNPWQTEPDSRMTQAAAEEELLSLLKDAVRLRMISDVPLGAFLSGGVDSSSVVAMMSEHSQAPVKTFTVGFQGQDNPEIGHARQVAARYGTEHVERMLSARTVPDALESVLTQFGEPFGDASAVPTYLVSQVAREEVTVALSGDGGDEFYGGYGLYGYLKFLQRLRYLPEPMVRGLAGAAGAFARSPGDLPSRGARFLERALDPIPKQHWYHRDNFVHGSAHRLLNDDMADWASRHWQPHTYPLFTGLEHLTCPDQAMRVDAQSYLIDDLLVKVDRASMATSLEVRSPFLDYRLVEFSLRVPHRLKLSSRKGGKLLLKRAMAPYLPDALLYQSKRGFTVPMQTWFQSSLRDYVEDMLFGDDVLHEYLSPAALRTVVDETHNGAADHSQLIWGLLVFAQWLRREVSDVWARPPSEVRKAV